MKLDKIINNYKCLDIKGNLQTEITSICSDSRKVEQGSMFIAVKGFAGDGHSYIPSAVAKGASAIVYEDKTAVSDIENNDIALIMVEDSREALAIMAANFFDNPSHKLTLVGITGTNGKTTTVNPTL